MLRFYLTFDPQDCPEDIECTEEIFKKLLYVNYLFL